MISREISQNTHASQTHTQVVSLETKIMEAEKELLKETDAEKIGKLQKDIADYRRNLATEKRAVMKDWLKTLFR